MTHEPEAVLSEAQPRELGHHSFSAAVGMKILQPAQPTYKTLQWRHRNVM